MSTIIVKASQNYDHIEYGDPKYAILINAKRTNSDVGTYTYGSLSTGEARDLAASLIKEADKFDKEYAEAQKPKLPTTPGSVLRDSSGFTYHLAYPSTGTGYSQNVTRWHNVYGDSFLEGDFGDRKGITVVFDAEVKA